MNGGDRARKLSRMVGSVLGIAAILTSSGVSARYCRDFNPSTSYLQIQLPPSFWAKRKPSLLDGIKGNSEIMELARANAGSPIVFSAAAIKYATIVSFIEQLAISVVAKNDPFLVGLHVYPLERSVRDAMGFGETGSRLMEPGEGLPDFRDVKLELVDVDDTTAFSDQLNKLAIDRGLVDRIVLNAVDRVFGGVEGYKAHLGEILSLTDRPPGIVVDVAATDITTLATYTVTDDNERSFPIGEVIENAFASGKTYNPFGKLRIFAQDVVGELVFIGAHEVGHIRNGHKAGKTIGCEQFSENERQADAYAAGIIAGLQFNMNPTNSGSAPLIDWGNFFEFYRDSGLTLTDLTTGCEYETPQRRKEWVRTAYEVAWGELTDSTFSSADYTTPNPTTSVCSDGFRTWRQPL